jgi:hypothetical protein
MTEETMTEAGKWLDALDNAAVGEDDETWDAAQEGRDDAAVEEIEIEDGTIYRFADDSYLYSGGNGRYEIDKEDLPEYFD